MRIERRRLEDMAEAIAAIERYRARGRAFYDAEELVRVWFRWHFLIIGEAANAISPGTQQLAPDIPWREIIGMRHVIAHGYFQIDDNVLWATAERDLGPLAEGVRGLLEQIPAN